MESIGYKNLLALIIGISMIVTCCTIAYFFQKYFFSKYQNKVKNTVKKASKN